MQMRRQVWLPSRAIYHSCECRPTCGSSCERANRVRSSASGRSGRGAAAFFRSSSSARLTAIAAAIFSRSTRCSASVASHTAATSAQLRRNYRSLVDKLMTSMFMTTHAAAVFSRSTWYSPPIASHTATASINPQKEYLVNVSY